MLQLREEYAGGKTHLHFPPIWQLDLHNGIR